MKDFFKYLLATVVGILITSLLTFFVFLGVIGTIMSKSDKPIDVKDNSLLVLKLNKEIADRGSNNPMANFDFMAMKPVTTVGLNDILKAIKNAADDPKIKGIYIENENIPAGAATLEEIRNALI
jgi:protease-4